VAVCHRKKFGYTESRKSVFLYVAAATLSAAAASSEVAVAVTQPIAKFASGSIARP
jgi:hypothetical protein